MDNILLQNFYTETGSTFNANSSENFSCEIKLNPEHPVYKGHFEQVSIAPGVCLTQVIKEILMDKFQKNLRMTDGDNIKFLAMVNPKETSQLSINFLVKIETSHMEVSASCSHNATTYVKFKGKFLMID